MATHMDVVNVQLTAANTRMNSNAKRPQHPPLSFRITHTTLRQPSKIRSF